MTGTPLNRRSVLTTLGKAFGAGGLLLSGSRAGAMALPLDIGPAAQLPLTISKLPVSPDHQRWRAMMDELHAMSVAQRENVLAGRPNRIEPIERCPWYQTSVAAGDVASRIFMRPDPTWADCVELAEICWRFLEKEWDPKSGRTNRLAAFSKHQSDLSHTTLRCATAALVEAVLTLGNGERRDPNTDQGRF